MERTTSCRIGFIDRGRFCNHSFWRICSWWRLDFRMAKWISEKNTVNGGDGLWITGEGKLYFKYPESDPTGESVTITLGGTAWSYFSNIVVG